MLKDNHIDYAGGLQAAIEKAYSALNRAFALTDYSIHNNLEKQHEFRKKTILADKSLTEDEKSFAMKISTKKKSNNKNISPTMKILTKK